MEPISMHLHIRKTGSAPTPAKSKDISAEPVDSVKIYPSLDLQIMERPRARAVKSMSPVESLSAAINVGSSVAGPMAAQALRALEGVSSKGEFPRKMTQEEKREYREVFPNLDVENTVVTGEATEEYNCISWTVGETHQWFWPPAMYPNLTEEAAFDEFYASYGFVAAEQGEVARWRNEQGLTHGCISGPGHGPSWESKCGAGLRIQHTLKELESPAYGKVDGFYTRKGGPMRLAMRKLIRIPENIKAGVHRKAADVDSKVREAFDENYRLWLEYRKKPEVRVRANPTDHCKTEAFERIVGLGPDAIPLLMEKIIRGDFFSLQAIEAIQKKSGGEAKLFGLDFRPRERATSEQNRAAQALINWYRE